MPSPLFDAVRGEVTDLHVPADYNFPSELYEAKFKSRGDSALSRRCVELLRANDIKARLSPRMEGRGLDGKSNEQKPGLDHGVFVPFKVRSIALVGGADG